MRKIQFLAQDKRVFLELTYRDLPVILLLVKHYQRLTLRNHL